MTFLEGMCPKCHKQIQVPDDVTSVLCMYCGQEIQITEALQSLEDQRIIQANHISSDMIYEEVREKYLSLLENIPDPMKNFKKQLYESSFRTYYQSNKYIIEALEKAYCVASDKEAFLSVVAEEFVSKAHESLSKIEKKGKREDWQIRNNMTMVVYILPMIAEYKGTISTPLSEMLVKKWNAVFEKTNIKVSSFDLINSGFKRRFCYITTAVCQSLHKEDNCYELTVLRKFRDEYLSSSAEGQELIRNYYDIAPSVVKHIDQASNSKEIYMDIYNTYISKCISHIENQDDASCCEVYTEMFYSLKNKYFYVNN